MFDKLIRFIFFGNYFIGLLAVVLSIEMCFQLDMPFNQPAYYLLLFIAPVIYYTYAFRSINETSVSDNERILWYSKNRRFINISQATLLFVSGIIMIFLFINNYNGLINLPLYYFVIIAGIVLTGSFYYGLISKKILSFNLRNIGWLKAFIIGFVWAAIVTVLPVIMLGAETGLNYFENDLWIWFFIKNWMFCTTNAIMFDIKDYPGDSNQQLRTFVVRFGLRRTITFILIPLLLCGLIAFCYFAVNVQMEPLRFCLNLLPFLLTLYVAYSLFNRKRILYYLVVIDGVILLKAICGILGVVITKDL